MSARLPNPVNPRRVGLVVALAAAFAGLAACEPPPTPTCGDPWSVPSGRGCELGRPLGFAAGYDDALACNGEDTGGSFLESWSLTDEGAHDCAVDCGCPTGSDCAEDCRVYWGRGFEQCWIDAYAEGYAAGDRLTDCDDM